MPDCMLCNIQIQSVCMLLGKRTNPSKFKQLLPVEPPRRSYEWITVKVKMPDSSEHRRYFHCQDTAQASCTRHVYFMYRYIYIYIYNCCKCAECR